MERYCQLVQEHYGSLQQRYVLQDVEGIQPSADMQEMLFADRLMRDWQPKLADQDKETAKASSKAKVESYKVIDGLRQFAREHVFAHR